mmetsp:Transcript_67847/g.180477  ORF Transcript_67847/g.180477 Transcript_67847/m.180477 type:complete len:230 (+) Transcript_67847:69-758(+)
MIHTSCWFGMGRQLGHADTGVTHRNVRIFGPAAPLPERPLLRSSRLGRSYIAKGLRCGSMLRARPNQRPPHPALSRVGAPVDGFSPFSDLFLQSFRWSKSPMYASVKSASLRLASSNDEPESTVLLKMAPTNEAPLKYARSTMPLVKSAPSKLAPGAYTLESCVSLKLTLLKSPSAISAPEMSKAAASAPDILHSRRSYSESRAAFAWPMADDRNLQRSFLPLSIGGKR